MSHRHYKFVADIGPDTQRLRRVLEILDTGAGPNFIRKCELHVGTYNLVNHGPVPQACDANGKPLSTIGTVQMPERLGNFSSHLELIVCENLAARTILGT